MVNRSYVLVSACRNEDAYVDGLIDCVASQRLRPTRWIIVDDSSTDATYTRAARRCRELPFLEVAKAPRSHPRSFSSQVFAAQYGCGLLKGYRFDYIGFLDADIRLSHEYYEMIIHHFENDPDLGLAGGAVIDKYRDRRENSRKGSEDYHVAGGVQLFRRRCFEQIGGYIPIDGGGQDTIADVMVMMNGWRIRTYPEVEAEHLRPDGYAGDSILTHGMKWGRKFNLIGYHPLFYFGQCIRRLPRRPFLVGSACQLLGYILAALRSEPRPVPPEFVSYLRKVQMQRVRKALWDPARAAVWKMKP